MVGLLEHYGSEIAGSLEFGAILALAASGLALSYSVSKIANFAHGEYITIGAYASAITLRLLGGNLALAFIISFVASGLVAAASYLFVFEPLEKRGASKLNLMVASIGLALFLRYTLYIIISYLEYAKAGGSAVWLSIHLADYKPSGEIFRAGNFVFSEFTLLVLATLVLVVATLAYLTAKTMFGWSLRAVADNKSLAEATGINVVRVSGITWFIAGGITGIGGMLLGFASSVQPELGWQTLLRVFAALVLGGMSGFYETMAGAFIVEFSEILGLRALSDFLNSTLHISVALVAYRMTVYLAIIIVVLLVRPKGLTGISLNLRGRIAPIIRFVKR